MATVVFAGTGIAGEAHVEGRRLMRQSHRFAGALDNQQRSDLSNALFDRLEADQFAVEFFQDLGNAGVIELLGKVYMRHRRCLGCVGRHCHLVP
jgi:hypothetical protein